MNSSYGFWGFWANELFYLSFRLLNPLRAIIWAHKFHSIRKTFWTSQKTNKNWKLSYCWLSGGEVQTLGQQQQVTANKRKQTAALAAANQQQSQQHHSKQKQQTATNKVERTHLKIPNTKRKYAKAWTSNKQNKK